MSGWLRGFEYSGFSLVLIRRNCSACQFPYQVHSLLACCPSVMSQRGLGC